MIANLPSYMCAKNYENRAWFDKVIAKIKWCNFFTHMVYPRLDHRCGTRISLRQRIYACCMFIKNQSIISPIPPSNFTGGEKSKIWPWFSTSVTFHSLWFRNWATHLKSNQTSEAPIIGYFLPNFGGIWSIFHSTPRTSGPKGGSLKNWPENFVESSIIQPWIALFCWNLVSLVREAEAVTGTIHRDNFHFPPHIFEKLTSWVYEKSRWTS